ncbi:hypothetical protein LCGC14_0589240 [marine sediment metagenome]|uniref:Uncharacterized protein n=1 Tax=marine sediment metagenome TaxID=412755 RepID=A0A0F9RXZ9_9ZZZZ
MVNLAITVGVLATYLFGVAVGYWIKSRAVKKEQLEQSE